MADIADRNPFGREWSEIEVAHVEQLLAATTDDEALHWEAKGGEVTADHVRRAITAFANREGGYLILGAERSSDQQAWTLAGATFAGTEPRTWLSNVIRTSISPPPEFDVHAWDRPDGRKAAVVRVQPNCGFLSMSQGRIYYRRPGESSHVENGAELQAIQNAVQYRSRAVPGGDRAGRAPQSVVATSRTLGMEADREAAAELVRDAIDASKASSIDSYVAAATHEVAAAIEPGDEIRLNDALDRIVDVAAIALDRDPDGPLVTRAIEGLQEAFDTGLRARGGSNRYPVERLWADTLARARALGALAVRLRRWRAVRALAHHQVDVDDSSVWRLWFRCGDVWASRGGLYTADDSVLQGSRVPVRLAAEHALRLPTLRPDGLDDEDALITSICQFEFLANLIAVSEASTDPSRAAWPYFAAWDGERLRPTADRLVSDPDAREALLPGTDDQGLADLLRQVSESAERACQSMGSWAFWYGFVSGKVRASLLAHPPHG